MAERLRAIEGAADAREGLHRFFEAFGGMTGSDPTSPPSFSARRSPRGIDPTVMPHLLEIMGVTRRLAERGHREGLFRRVDPVLFHFGLVGALGFFFATEPARRRRGRRTTSPSRCRPPTPSSVTSRR